MTRFALVLAAFFTISVSSTEVYAITCPPGYGKDTICGESSCEEVCTPMPSNGCAPDALAGTAGTELEGKLDDLCSGRAFDENPKAKSKKFQKKFNAQVQNMIDTYNQTLEDAKNFQPEVVIDQDAILENLHATSAEVIANGMGGTSYMEDGDATGVEPIPNMLPPVFVPDQPCTWPKQDLDAIRAVGDSCDELPEGSQSRMLCEDYYATAGSDLPDCPGVDPGKCEDYGLFTVDGICQCDDPKTADVEPCTQYSACAATNQWQLPNGQCHDDCASFHPLLIDGPGMYCICVDDPATPDVVEDCMIGWLAPGTTCPQNPDLFIQSDGFKCGCDNPTTHGRDECNPIIGNPGDICPTDPSLYVQTNQTSCGCDNPMTMAVDECDPILGDPGDICPSDPGGPGGLDPSCDNPATDPIEYCP